MDDPRPQAFSVAAIIHLQRLAHHTNGEEEPHVYHCLSAGVVVISCPDQT
jgi:hypothetical protein